MLDANKTLGEGLKGKGKSTMRSDARGSSEGIVQQARCLWSQAPPIAARKVFHFSFTPDYYPHFRQESLGTIQSSLTRRPYYSWFFRALKACHYPNLIS